MWEKIVIAITVLLYFVGRLGFEGAEYMHMAALGLLALLALIYAGQLKISLYAVLCVVFSGSMVFQVMHWPYGTEAFVGGLLADVVFAGLFFWSGWKDYQKTGQHSLFVYAVSVILLLQAVLAVMYLGASAGNEGAKMAQNLNLVLLGAIGTITLQEYDLSSGERKYLNLLLVTCIFSAIQMIMQYV